MSTLYDRIMTRGFGINERAKHVMEPLGQILREAVVVDISNVAQYFRAMNKDRHDWSWTRGDFPNSAPPWPTFFMELPPGDSGVKDGILFDCLDLSPAEQKPLLFGPNGETVQGARWVVCAWPFIRLSGEDPRRRFVPVRMQFGVGPEGQRVAIGDSGSAFCCESYEWDIDDADERKIFRLCCLNYQKWLLFPSLLAISFMHCKNVKLIDDPIPPKLTKAYECRHGRPMVRYKTLEITPMKEVLRHQGQSETLGLKKALHICRGHFKDYTARGLFGKVHGMFWWDTHVRGTLEQGIVIKDYTVNKPAQTWH